MLFFIIISFIIGIMVGYNINSRLSWVKKLLSREYAIKVIQTLLNKYHQQQQSAEPALRNKLVLFLVNLDHFHGIIEAFGEEISDKIINVIYKRFSIYVKQSGFELYRFGLDEYLIFSLGKLNSETQIIDIANKIIGLIADPISLDQSHINVTGSIGISIYPDHDPNDGGKLLRNAQLALQMAKKSGRNTYSFYCKSLIDTTVDRAVIKNDLLTALRNDDLQLVWQPQIDLSTNQLVGAEVLIRWNHLVKGTLSPELFIGIAESTGLIWQVGIWIIKNACIQCKSILSQANIKDFKAAVNLSSGQFLHGDVVTEIAEAIYNTGISPNNFEVEITESMFMHDVEKSTYMISVLNSMGIKVAIDDFGTGYSSFGRLSQINFDYLKIDQSFIGQIDIDKKKFSIVKAMIAMAKTLGIKVIAEGIENVEQLSLLKGIGCDFGQGYLFSKPLAVKDFIDFANNRS